MVIILKENSDSAQLENLIAWLETKDISIHKSEGENSTILGLVGDTSALDIDMLQALSIVKDVKRIQEPFKNAGRQFHPNDTVIDVSGVLIGGGNTTIIAGPCSVESREQLLMIAQSVKKSGAKMLRGGAFKPRTSPYAFQGLGADGLTLLLEAKKETGLPIVTEILDASQIPLFEDVDIIQVGARNMQNFELLKELGKLRKPILLKRGIACTINELLMSAEYLLAGGNSEVILCERGIRTFETQTRYTLDLSAIPVLRSLSHLPIIVDPSHSTGNARFVHSMSVAAIAAGADGLLIEVHNDPACALCDGQQSLTPWTFDRVAKSVFAVAPYACRERI